MQERRAKRGRRFGESWPHIRPAIARDLSVELVARGIVSMDAYDHAFLRDRRERKRRRRAARGVVFEVLDEALDRDVRDAVDHVEMVAMHVPVEDDAHLPALLEDRAELGAVLHEGAMFAILEPARVGEILLARRV